MEFVKPLVLAIPTYTCDGQDCDASPARNVSPGLWTSSRGSAASTFGGGGAVQAGSFPPGYLPPFTAPFPRPHPPAPRPQLPPPPTHFPPLPLPPPPLSYRP